MFCFYKSIFTSSRHCLFYAYVHVYLYYVIRGPGVRARVCPCVLNGFKTPIHRQPVITKHPLVLVMCIIKTLNHHSLKKNEQLFFGSDPLVCSLRLLYMYICRSPNVYKYISSTIMGRRVHFNVCAHESYFFLHNTLCAPLRCFRVPSIVLVNVRYQKCC